MGLPSKSYRKQRVDRSVRNPYSYLFPPRGRKKVIRKKRSSGVKDARLLTWQNDTRTEYRRRRAPRRVRRRAGRFVHRVERVIQSTLPLQVYRYADNYTTTTIPRSATYFSVPLYPGGNNNEAGGVSDVDWNHLMQIFNTYYSAGGVGEPPLNLVGDAKVLFQSGIMDLNITNNTAPVAPNDGAAYITIYRCRARRDSCLTAEQMFYLGLTKLQSPTLPSSTFNLTITDTAGGGGGCPTAITPFDSPDFCRHWLVLNRRTVTLAPGQTTRLQMKDHKEHIIKYSDICQYQHYSAGTFTYLTMTAFRRFTTCYFIIFQGAPSEGDGSSQAVSLAYQYQVYYRFRLVTPALNANQSGFVNFPMHSTEYGSVVSNLPNV